ncbi:MAG: D-aminoacylase [Gemmatimonadaceae bacterium]
MKIDRHNAVGSGARCIAGYRAALLLATLACAPTPAFDLILSNGTVVDGTGAPRRVADVAIAGGRIVAVDTGIAAHRARQARRVVDVSGLVVAPGFWDNHAHLVTLDQHPRAENFVRQGITTIMASLHSQEQPFPLDAYRARVHMAPNVGLFAGHTWIRKRVMGLVNRAPTATELAWMKALVDSSMQQGALGLSTGLEYVPATYSNTDELVALAGVAAPYGGIYVTHMRDEGPGVLASIRETLEIGARAHIPVQVNHLKVTGAAQWGWSDQILALLDSARAAGNEVAFDIYPYTAYSTYADLMFPPWALADGPAAFARRVADPATHARLVREMRILFPRQAGRGPESIQFREVPSDSTLAGKTLADFLHGRGRSTSIDEAVEALIELQLKGGFIGIFHGMDQRDVERFLQHPATMFETDGDLVELGTGFPHPRSYGSFPRVIAQYVRERPVLTLEEAIRKMTALPAAWLGDGDRGVLAPGKAADVVVFNLNEIADRSGYTDPHHYAEGVRHVLVNGTFVLESGAMTGALPGTFLQRQRPRR